MPRHLRVSPVDDILYELCQRVAWHQEISLNEYVRRALDARACEDAANINNPRVRLLLEAYRASKEVTP